jgi:replicative DNA helicase
MDAETIAVICTSILTLISTLLGAKYSNAKAKAETKIVEVQTVLRDVVALSEKVVEAGMDDKVTEDEYRGIAEALQKTLVDAKKVIS